MLINFEINQVILTRYESNIEPISDFPSSRRRSSSFGRKLTTESTTKGGLQYLYCPPAEQNNYVPFSCQLSSAFYYRNQFVKINFCLQEMSKIVIEFEPSNFLGGKIKIGFKHPSLTL